MKGKGLAADLWHLMRPHMTLSRWSRVVWKEDEWGNTSHSYYHSKKYGLAFPVPWLGTCEFSLPSDTAPCTFPLLPAHIEKYCLVGCVLSCTIHIQELQFCHLAGFSEKQDDLLWCVRVCPGRLPVPERDGAPSTTTKKKWTLATCQLHVPKFKGPTWLREAPVPPPYLQ